MCINESSYKAKIGVVSIDTINNKVIRIKYTYPKGKRNAFYVGIINEENWREAIKTAHIIDRNISIGDYDPTLVRYKLNKAQTLEVVEKQSNPYVLYENFVLFVIRLRSPNGNLN